MGLALIVGPATEPISLAEARAHCRIDIIDDDALLMGLITTFRQRAEAYTRRALITQQWRLTAIAFPRSVSVWPHPLVYPTASSEAAMALPRPPLISVESVKYIDENGVQQTLSPAAYVVSTSELPGCIAPVFGTSWPNIRSQIGAVQVDFTAGYGTAIPAAIKTWMLCYILAAYDNRSATITGRSISAIDMPYVDHLLDEYIVDSAL